MEIEYSKDREGKCYQVSCGGRYRNQIDCSEFPSTSELLKSGKSQATELKCINSTKPISRNEDGQCYAHFLCPAPSASPIQCPKSLRDSSSLKSSPSPITVDPVILEKINNEPITIKGSVYNKKYELFVKGVSILLTSEKKQVRKQIFSENGGIFEFRDILPAKDYIIHLSLSPQITKEFIRQGYREGVRLKGDTSWSVKWLKSEEHVILPLPLEHHLESLFVKVVDEQNQPIENALITVMPSESGFKFRKEAKTNHLGNAILNIPSTNLSVNASKEGYLSRNDTLDAYNKPAVNFIGSNSLIKFPDNYPSSSYPYDITTFNGKVYDSKYLPVDKVKITAKSLDPTISFQKNQYTIGGTYSFNEVPVGIKIEVTAEKEGYLTRRIIIRSTSNTQRTPNDAKHDFGTDGTANSTGSEENALVKIETSPIPSPTPSPSPSPTSST